VLRLRDHLVRQGKLDEDAFQKVLQEADTEMDAAVSAAVAAEAPTHASMFEDVYAPDAPKPAPVAESWQP
jgi:TPP-dependent pyruvate/acetoin dehydrogenase alpha subunit